MKSHILHTLQYFSLFQHPLTLDELHQFLNQKVSREELDLWVSSMIESEELSERNGFLHRTSDPDFSSLRKEKEARAKRLLQKSRLYASVIARFPFVRSVAISGSLSKLSAPEDADIDFFIITAGGKLWIARTLLHLFKKLTFVTGHERFYCMNYFVDEDHLKLPFENEYTAVELMTLIPVFGAEKVEELKHRNSWTRQHLPNHDGKPLTELKPVKPFAPLKMLWESIITGMLLPARLNRWLMEVTDKKWRKKFADLNLSPEAYDRAMMTRPYLSKNHPHDYQKKVLDAIEKPTLNPSPVNAFS